MVHIISSDGKQLMPTNRHGKIKHLLREGKAKVVKRNPFTVQLLYASTLYTQKSCVEEIPVEQRAEER